MAKAVLLTPAQETQILRAGAALDDPESFARVVHQRLESEFEIGDGLVFRVCRSLQPAYFIPPPDTAINGNHRPQQLRKIR